MNFSKQRLFCIIFLVACLSECLISALELSLKDEDLNKQTFLVSYGGSGNTWTRYCLEFLTKRPTLHIPIEEFNNNPSKIFEIDTTTKDMINPINNTIPLGVDYSKLPIVKFHHFSRFFPPSKFANKSTLFILLIRNPKECLLRGGTVKDLKNFGRSSAPFFANLQIYDNWNPKTRKLIYYEDLIEHPRKTLKSILDFLGEDDRYLNDFMLHFEQHKQNSLDFYTFTDHVSRTKGKKSLFYSNKLTKQKKIAIDNAIKNANPQLWNKYLVRYEEKG